MDPDQEGKFGSGFSSGEFNNTDALLDVDPIGRGGSGSGRHNLIITKMGQNSDPYLNCGSGSVTWTKESEVAQNGGVYTHTKIVLH